MMMIRNHRLMIRSLLLILGKETPQAHKVRLDDARLICHRLGVYVGSHWASEKSPAMVGGHQLHVSVVGG